MTFSIKEDSVIEAKKSPQNSFSFPSTAQTDTDYLGRSKTLDMSHSNNFSTLHSPDAYNSRVDSSNGGDTPRRSDKRSLIKHRRDNQTYCGTAAGGQCLIF